MTDKTAAWKDNEVLFLLARLVVGLVFLTMGWSKISDPVAFLKLIREYDMVSVEAPWILNSMAALLPWLEIWCGLLLLTGVAVRGASAVAFVLLATFTLAIASRTAELSGLTGTAYCAVAFDCGCGAGVVNGCNKLLENIGLLLACCLVFVSRGKTFCLRKNLFSTTR